MCLVGPGRQRKVKDQTMPDHAARNTTQHHTAEPARTVKPTQTSWSYLLLLALWSPLPWALDQTTPVQLSTVPSSLPQLAQKFRAGAQNQVNLDYVTSWRLGGARCGELSHGPQPSCPFLANFQTSISPSLSLPSLESLNELSNLHIHCQN